MPETKGYEPSEEEVREAEGHLTESEKYMSERRQINASFWDTEKQTGIAEGRKQDSHTWKNLQKETEKGAEIIELQIPLTIKIPKNKILFSQGIENCVWLAEQDALPEVVRQMNEKYPNIIADYKELADVQYEFAAMFADSLKRSHTSSEPYRKSESYNLERARELIARAKEISSKYGDEYDERYDRERIESVGDQL